MPTPTSTPSRKRSRESTWSSPPAKRRNPLTDQLPSQTASSESVAMDMDEELALVAKANLGSEIRHLPSNHGLARIAIDGSVVHCNFAFAEQASPAVVRSPAPLPRRSLLDLLDGDSRVRLIAAVRALMADSAVVSAESLLRIVVDVCFSAFPQRKIRASICPVRENGVIKSFLWASAPVY